MTEVICDLNHTEVSLIGSVEEEDDWTGTMMCWVLSVEFDSVRER